MPANLSIDPGAAVAAAGILITAVQVILGLRRERFENTFHLIDRLQDPVMLTIRNSTVELMQKAKDLSYDFYKLSAEERAQLSGVANLFGLAGLLAKRRLVERRLLLEGWSRHITATYERLEPYFEWRKRLRGGDSLRPYFEWLVSRAQRTPTERAINSRQLKLQSPAPG